MSELASSGQLRTGLLRWVLVLVPGILLLGFVSGMLANSGPANPWFSSLVKPDIYPPPQVFGIVWSVLYAMMGVALAIVVTARGAPGRGVAIGVFVVQLVLNLAWSPLFFGARQITLALYLLIALDLLVVLTVVLFWRVRPIAAMLLVPYLGWVLFATLLNWEFRLANPGADGAQVTGAVQRYEL